MKQQALEVIRNYLTSDAYYRSVVKRDPLIPIDKMITRQEQLIEVHTTAPNKIGSGLDVPTQISWHEELKKRAESRAEFWRNYEES